MYNLSMSGTNPTSKTEAHNSVPFITKVVLMHSTR